MRILFFTLVEMRTIYAKGIYPDMVKDFVKKGHHVDYFFPLEKNFTQYGNNYSLNSIKVRHKIQKTNNFIYKYLSYKFLESTFSKIIRNTKISYDLLIIVTPSIFQTKIVKSFKFKFNNSKVLLLLKDIFPDNALDLKILSNKFPKFLILKYFKYIEARLYKLVDKIGVMTELNRDYFSQHNKQFINKVFMSPNSIEFYEISKINTPDKLGIPLDKVIITFIGNIGLPQYPEKIRELIDNSNKNFFFIFIGTGSKEKELNNFSSSKLLFINKNLSQTDVDQYLINSHLGLVVLNKKFNVPNFPSKILSYLNACLSILAITNEYNDLRYLINIQIIPGI